MRVSSSAASAAGSTTAALVRACCAAVSRMGKQAVREVHGSGGERHVLVARRTQRFARVSGTHVVVRDSDHVFVLRIGTARAREKQEPMSVAVFGSSQ